MDGGVDEDTIGRCAEAGADVFVAGSAVFRNHGNYAASLAELVQGARRGRQRGGGPVPKTEPPSLE